METEVHQLLKCAAVEYLLSRGCAAVAAEVRCPISRYRVDAAGYLDDLPQEDEGRLDPAHEVVPGLPKRVRGRARAPATVFIECKATRADFLRDAASAPRLLAKRDGLMVEMRAIEEEVVKVSEPHLRRSGCYLFPELESWDFAGSSSPAYRAVLRELRRLDRLLYDSTKFFMMHRYRLGSRLLMLAPAGMVACGELPVGWGLLEWGAGGGPLRMARAGPDCGATAARVARGLRNIAAASTRAAARRALELPEASVGPAQAALDSDGGSARALMPSTGAARLWRR